MELANLSSNYKRKTKMSLEQTACEGQYNSLDFDVCGLKIYLSLNKQIQFGNVSQVKKCSLVHTNILNVTHIHTNMCYIQNCGFLCLCLLSEILDLIVPYPILFLVVIHFFICITTNNKLQYYSNNKFLCVSEIMISC